MGSSSNVGGASTSTAPPERSALIDLYQSLHGSTDDSSSKDSSEEMESFGTLTHGALQSDLHILLFAHFFLLRAETRTPSPCKLILMFPLSSWMTI